MGMGFRIAGDEQVRIISNKATKWFNQLKQNKDNSQNVLVQADMIGIAEKEIKVF